MNPRKSFRFIGNLGADPELSTTKSGRSYCRFSICINTRYKDKDSGENKKISEWFYPVIWGKRAETFVKIAKKGTLVALEGDPTANSVEDSASGKKYQTPGFSVNNFEILSYKNSDENREDSSSPQQSSDTDSSPSESSSSGGRMIQDSEESGDNVDYNLDGDEDNSFEAALGDSDDEIPF